MGNTWLVSGCGASGSKLERSYVGPRRLTRSGSPKDCLTPNKHQTFSSWFSNDKIKSEEGRISRPFLRFE